MKKKEMKNAGLCGGKFRAGSIVTLGAAMAMVLTTACQVDNENEGEFVILPEEQTITTDPNTFQTFSFSVNSGWVLTSGASWCTFGGELSISGTAGDNVVTLTISDAEMNISEDSQAELTLTAGGMTGVVCKVIRKAPGIVVSMTDSEGNPVDAVTAGWNNYDSYTIEANFGFAVTSQPEWLQTRDALTSSAGVPVTAEFKVADDPSWYKYPQSGQIVLGDASGALSYSFEIGFAGMDEDQIRISGPSVNVWGWTISADGKTVTSGENTLDPQFTLAALNYGYVVVFADHSYEDDWVFGVERTYDPDSEYSDVDWIHSVSDGKGNVSLSVDAIAGGERSAYVYAFPTAVYETIKGNLAGALLDEDYEFDTKWESNVMCSLVQKEEVSDLFVVQNGVTLAKLKVSSEYSTGYTAYAGLRDSLAKEFETEDIAVVHFSFSDGHSYIVAPLPLSTSNTWVYTAVLYDGDGDLAVPAGEGKLEGSNYYEGATPYPAVNVYFPGSAGMPLYLTFKESDSHYKILIFTDL